MVQPAVLSQSLRLFCKKSMSNSKCRVPRLVIKRSFLKYNRNVEVTGNFPVNWRLQRGCSGGCYGLAVLSSQPHLPGAQLSFLTLKPKLPLGPDQSGGASTRVPCSPTASVLGSGKCPSSSGQDFGLGIPDCILQRNLLLSIRLSPKEHSHLTQHRRSLGHLCPGGDGAGVCALHVLAAELGPFPH